MEIILLGIYSFFVWLIFFKFKWLPWTTTSQVTVAVIPIVALTALILLLNVVAPSSADVRVFKYTIPIVSQVRGRVIEVPVEEGNRLVKKVKAHEVRSWYLLRSIPGVGKILSLVLLYEIHDIRRFPRVQDFVSYCRLVKCPRESGGKKFGAKNSKIGNVHLKWAFSEAACLFLRGNEQAQHYHSRLVSKHGKGKALSILAHKIGRAVYFMLKRKEPFNMETFFARA